MLKLGAFNEGYFRPTTGYDGLLINPIQACTNLFNLLCLKFVAQDYEKAVQKIKNKNTSTKLP